MTAAGLESYSVFSQILSEVFVTDEIREMEECGTKHVFSAEFERKMQKLIKSRKRPYYSLVCTAGRRAACIGTAVLIAGGTAMSVDAVREAVAGFAAEHFAGHDEFSVVTDPEFPYPDTIMQGYDIDVPEGFYLEEDVSVDTDTCRIRSYMSDKNYIVFFQYTTDSFDSKISTRLSKPEYYTDNNGVLYTIYRWDENEGNYNVLWQKDGYVFQLNSDLERDEVIDMCVNMKMNGKSGGLK